VTLAEFFADNDKIVVMLGDNVIEKNINGAVEDFRKQKEGAKVLLKEVDDPQRFGVPTFEDGKIVNIEEKPSSPASSYAVIGIYMYDNTVFDFIKTLKPSGRGELEITDVNNYYIDRGTITHDILYGWWTDAGTFESLQYAGNMVAKTGANKV
jgi:glucose-1-phosphate thymidylyltransferase